MYLSKLSLHGFKSFAQKTQLDFDPGVTAVVGPNGCGKSNIVDAVRWVTGEQRARILRSDKMDSVIFNGSAKRKPLGMSEVMLTIQNTKGILPTEYSEVTIGRRLYRSGESEYILNGVQCRLRDILDLFMDTGMGPGAYSVIELKMIDDILSENTQDRRRLFEEAAGITKYKLRRTQALRKLDNTQANLTRIRDLTDEIGKRVASLQRQAEKAARAKELNAELEVLELAVAQTELSRYLKLEKELSEEARNLKDQLELHTVQQTQEEAELESLRVDLIAHEKELSVRQRALNEHLEEVRTLETEKRLTLERLDSARRNIERAQQEQEEANVRVLQLQDNQKTLRVELEEAEPVLAKAREVADKAQVESESTTERAKEAWEQVKQLRQDQERLEQERADRRRKLDRLANRVELIEQDSISHESQIEGLDAKVLDAEKRLEKASSNLESVKSAVNHAKELVEAVEKERESLQQKWESAIDSQRQVERQFDAVTAEASLLESLISSYEDVSEAVQFLAEKDEWSSGPMLTVADLLGADPADQQAVDAALGSFASCIVVKTEKEAHKAIAMLRAEGKGQTELIVLDRLRPPTRYAEFIEEAADRGAYPLIDKVRVSEPGYQRLADALFYNCFLVKSLEHGQDLIETLDEMANMLYGASVPMRYIAPSGEWLDARGIFRGGSQRSGETAHVSRLQRREQYEEAVQSLRSLEAALQQKNFSAAELKESLEALPYEDRKRTLTDAERLLAEAEKEYVRESHACETLKQRKSEMAARIAGMQELMVQAKTDIEQLEAPVEQFEEELAGLRSRRDKAEEAFRVAESDKLRALERYNEANIAALQARNHHDNLLRDVKRSKEDVETLLLQKEGREKHIDSLRESIDKNEKAEKELEEQITEKYVDRAGLDEAVDEVEQIRQEANLRIMELDSKLRSIRQTRERDIRAENERAVKLVEVQTRMADLLHNIEEAFERSLLDEPAEIPKDFDAPAARKKVRELKSSIRSLGSINELALESYEEEKERFEFMSAQREDLEKAEQSLLDTITEINTTASERFDKTFQKVRVNFARLFSTLFGKDDSADLLLADPDDPLESPIEIIAKPKGKRPSAITQLSGGEKTLTATALLFAIYLVKPSPFCILDEVDAPLDEANVERFMQLIREFAHETQFIMVTHNRRTMELADRLYGVTMQEEGVSKLLGVKFDEASELAAA